MGKIRIKTLGDEALEEKQQKEARLAREARQAKKRQEKKKTAKAPGLKGGERVVAIGPSEKELAKTKASQETKGTEYPKAEKKEAESREARSRSAGKKAKFAKKRARSKHYALVAKTIDKTKVYSLNEALELLPKLGLAKFDETVELHINTTEPGITGEVTLPHGSGKQVRVAIVDNKLIAEIEKGKIDFDVLLAAPQMMLGLAKVAKILGPRGLMPNPKNGTLVQNPETAAKKYQGGLIRFKTEAKLPVMHFVVGKVSFGEKKLAENIQTVFDALPKIKIKNITLKSTMSPGIKINLF